jgi:hypothetical protein
MIEKPLEENIISENSPIKESKMKWVRKKGIHKKLGGEIQ